MTDDNESVARNLGKVGAAVGGAALGAVVVANPVAGAALGAVATEGLALAVKVVGDYRMRRAEKWWRDYVRHLGTMNPEGAVTVAAHRAAEDPDFQERVYHALNAVWSAVEDQVLPCLAYLAADYEARGKPVDPVYKHVARFLQETSHAELEHVRALVLILEKAFASGARDVHLVIGRRASVVALTSQEHGELGRFDVPVGTDAVVRRLRDGYLVDEGRGVQDGISVTATAQHFETLQRYIATPFVGGGA